MLVQKEENATAWLESRPGRSNVHAEAKEWSTIWQLKVPSKISVFLWRLARHSIPTADVLHRCHMAEQAACLICGAPDSWKHSLLECNMAKCVWALAREDTMEHICNIQEQSAKAWLAAAISSLSVEESRRTMVTLWAMWHAKRKAVYENIFQSPLSTHSFVERFIADLDLSISRPEARQKTAASFRRWIPPPRGVSKINVDATLSKNSSKASAVARDEAGNFLGASAVMMLGITEHVYLRFLSFNDS
jgi:hypothetical protein